MRWFGTWILLLLISQSAELLSAQEIPLRLSAELGPGHRFGYLSWNDNSLVATLEERKFQIPPRYFRAGPFGDCVFRRREQREPPRYLAPVQEEPGKPYGYIDPSGEYKIAPQFDYASEFSEGRATVQVRGKFRVIDEAGKFPFDNEYDWIGAYRSNRALVRDRNRYGYIDDKGVIVIPAEFESAENFSEGVATVRTGGTVKFIGVDGNPLTQFPTVSNAGSFKSGLMLVQIENRQGYVQRNGKFLSESFVVPFDWATSFQHQYAIVGVGESVTLIDRNGKSVIDKDLKQVLEFNDHELLACDQAGETLLYRRDGKGSNGWSKQKALSPDAKILVNFVCDKESAEVYKARIWEFEEAEKEQNIPRILTRNRMIGTTGCHREFTHGDAFAIVFLIKDKNPCVAYWYPDSQDPVSCPCK